MSKNSAAALAELAADKAGVREIYEIGQKAWQSEHAEPEKAATDRRQQIAAVTDLRDGLRETVGKLTDSAGPERIFIFVGDLDRLPPARAVELMEALKVFLDIEGLVFVLAIDFDVVVRGIEEKYPGMDSSKGRSFFDKIIQVPFNLPVALYEVHKLIRSGLENSRVNVDDPDALQHYVGLVEKSVGRNPRSIKRLLNTYALLQLIQENLTKTRRAVAGAAAEDGRDSGDVFAILCLQEGFPEFFGGLVRASTKSDGYAGYVRTLMEATANPTVAVDSGTAPLDADVQEALEDLAEHQSATLHDFLGMLAKQFELPDATEAKADLSNSQERLARALISAAVTAVGLTSDDSSAVSMRGKPLDRAQREERQRKKTPQSMHLSRAFEDALNRHLGSVNATAPQNWWSYGLTETAQANYDHPTKNPNKRFAELAHSASAIRCSFGEHLSEDQLDAWVEEGRKLGLTTTKLKSTPVISVTQIRSEKAAELAAQLVADSFKEVFDQSSERSKR